MDFTLSDDQQLLRDTARGLLEKECPPSLVRAYQDDPSAAEGLWKHLQGWLELGQGPLVDLCLFLEEMGAVVAPGPFFATTVLWSGWRTRPRTYTLGLRRITRQFQRLRSPSERARYCSSVRPFCAPGLT